MNGKSLKNCLYGQSPKYISFIDTEEGSRIEQFFRLRRKWNLMRYCTAIVSLAYAQYKTNEPIKPSMAEKISDALDKHQVKIQLVTIYAGLIGIVLEGYCSNTII